MSKQLAGTTRILLWSCLALFGGCGSGSSSRTSDAGDALDAGADGSSEDAALDDGSMPDAHNTDEGCSRAALSAQIEAYFDALSAHDPAELALAATVKITENGEAIEAGDGLWTSAGALKFKRSALDTTTCSSVTESVLSEGDTEILFGLRLRLEAGEISEIETMVVRAGDYISSPAGLLGTLDDEWETVLPEAERPTREDLRAVVDAYFIRFPEGACGFADDCVRYENGLATGRCSLAELCGATDASAGSRSMAPRLYVLDVETGIAVGFTMFTGRTIPGTYTDFHMFKYRGGNVHGIHATLAGADDSGWE